MDLILWSHAIVDGVDNMQKSGVLKHQKSQVYQTFVRRPKWEKKAKAAIEQFPNKSICEAVRTEHHQALVSHFKTTRGTKIKREAANEKNQVRQVSNCERAVWRTVSARRDSEKNGSHQRGEHWPSHRKKTWEWLVFFSHFPGVCKNQKKKGNCEFHTSHISVMFVRTTGFFFKRHCYRKKAIWPCSDKNSKVNENHINRRLTFLYW